METAIHSNASISYSPKKCRHFIWQVSWLSFVLQQPSHAKSAQWHYVVVSITVAGTATDLHRTSLLNYM